MSLQDNRYTSLVVDKTLLVGRKITVPSILTLQFTTLSLVLSSEFNRKIELVVPSNLQQSYSLILPPTRGLEGQVLTSVGNGFTEWAESSGGGGGGGGGGTTILFGKVTYSNSPAGVAINVIDTLTGLSLELQSGVVVEAIDITNDGNIVGATPASGIDIFIGSIFIDAIRATNFNPFLSVSPRTQFPVNVPTTSILQVIPSLANPDAMVSGTMFFKIDIS